jgi:hypothetical protein
MTAFPVVVGLDVFKDIGPSRLPRRVADLVHLLYLQGMEEACHGRMVITVALLAYATEEAVLVQERLIVQRGILLLRSEWRISPGTGRRRKMAMVRAAITSSRVIRSLIDPPTTAREYRSSTTAR